MQPRFGSLIRRTGEHVQRLRVQLAVERAILEMVQEEAAAATVTPDTWSQEGVAW